MEILILLGYAGFLILIAKSARSQQQMIFAAGIMLLVATLIYAIIRAMIR